MRHVHFIAIAGTGMGSLAGLMKSRGLEVTGSDAGVYPPMSTALEAWGIPVAEGFRPENVLERRPDLVVIGNAVRADNPEARAAIEATKTDISWGNQIRSYVFQPYTMVNDHRTELKVSDVRAVMDGEITQFIETFLKKFGGRAA